VVIPPLVKAALELAEATGFQQSCRPEQGELLRLLARGAGPAVIGETGTGCGVGLAWLASAAAPGSTLVSIDRDPHRTAAVTALFQAEPAVQILTGEWPALRAHGPFDLLILDGGGQGKGNDPNDPPLNPAEWLRPGGLIVMDDFTPSTTWPPMYQGRVDEPRRYWLTHPDLRATQINIAPDAATIFATYLPTTR
jgi:predicted O-methyltransferase YrrM